MTLTMSILEKKKPKYWSTIEAQYGRDPISKRQWNKLQFWEKVIGDHYSQVWTRKYTSLPHRYTKTIFATNKHKL
jgi:hypothetical protein